MYIGADVGLVFEEVDLHIGGELSNSWSDTVKHTTETGIEVTCECREPGSSDDPEWTACLWQWSLHFKGKFDPDSFAMSWDGPDYTCTYSPGGAISAPACPPGFVSKGSKCVEHGGPAARLFSAGPGAATCGRPKRVAGAERCVPTSSHARLRTYRQGL